MKRPKGKTLDELHTEWQRDPEYVAAYEDLKEEFGVAEALANARTRAGLTQAQLAAKIGSRQSAVSRLEAGYQDPKLSTIGDYALATGMEFRIAQAASGHGFRITVGKPRGAIIRTGRGSRAAKRVAASKARA